MASRFWVGGTATWDAVTTTNWAATSGGAGGQTVPGAADTVTFDASSGGGTVTVGAAYNPSITSITMGAFTGTLDFSVNNNSPTMTIFNCNGSGVRTLKDGTGTWNITGNAAGIIRFDTVTNLTFVSTAIWNCTYAGSTGTRTITLGTGVTGLNNLKISAGTDTVTFNQGSGVIAGYLDFTGFTGTYTPTSNQFLGGNFTLNTGMTVTSVGSTLTINGNSTITTNNIVYNSNITIDGVGKTVILADNLDMSGASARTLTLTNGTFNANNLNVTCGGFSSSNSNTRVLTMGSGTWTITATGTTAFTTATTTGLTVTATTSTVKFTNTSSTGLTFAGGGKTFGNIWFARGTSTAINTISGSNTFTDFKDDGSVAHTNLFTAGTTTTVTTFTVSGSSGNIITLNSTVNGTPWILSKASGVVSRDYLTIRDSQAQGGANFYAGANSTSTSGNTGWQFFAANTPQNANFFFFN